MRLNLTLTIDKPGAPPTRLDQAVAMLEMAGHLLSEVKVHQPEHAGLPPIEMSGEVNGENAMLDVRVSLGVGELPDPLPQHVILDAYTNGYQPNARHLEGLRTVEKVIHAHVAKYLAEN